MKKGLVLLLIGVLVVGIGAFAFAESTDTAPEWFTEMIKWKKDQVQEALDDDQITEEQAEFWMERIDGMEKYHEENGFDFPGGCGNGRFGKENRSGRGFGPGKGMMGGYHWNNQSN